MAEWCPNDKKTFQTTPNGQIDPRGGVGQYLIQFLQNQPDIQTLVEIGTWNGMGSTRCILMGLQGKTYTSFQSYECNREKQEFAKNALQTLLTANDQLIWGSILIPNECSTAFQVFPELRENAMFQQWHSYDMQNMERCPYVWDMVPQEIDFLLLDGGEFTTHFEFHKLLPRCTKFIALDDVNVSKCKGIRETLKQSTEWGEILYMPERNGFSLFAHVNAKW